jgi:hypothetical protein
MKKLKIFRELRGGERERRKEGFSKDNETNIVEQLAPPSTLFL